MIVNTNELLTGQETATALGITTGAVCNLATRNRLKTISLLGRTMYRKAEVAALIDERIAIKARTAQKRKAEYNAASKSLRHLTEVRDKLNT